MVRLSFGVYTNEADIERLLRAVRYIARFEVSKVDLPMVGDGDPVYQSGPDMSGVPFDRG
jgi:propanediol utilization protein